jgi:hypothetical protein
LRTDNKALSFLGKCAVTSNRIARLVMHIQEYNFHTEYISWTENCLADTVRRNPSGLCERDTKELFKPKDMMVATINLGPDNSVERSLKELPTCQTRVKKIQEIIRTVEQKQENASKNVMVQNDILYKKNSHRYPYWVLSLPRILKSLWSDTYLHRWGILAPKMHSSVCHHFSCKGSATVSQEVYFSMWYLPKG